jgi:uncharacterized protein
LESGFRKIVPGARAAILALIATFLCGCTSLFLWPDRTERVTPAALGLTYEDIWLDTDDGVRIHAWHLRSDRPRRGIVLYFHGNTRNNSAYIELVQWLPGRGFDVFMVDPRGYGQSQGRADLGGLHLDAQTALAYLAARACGEIIVFGQSLGGALAINAAAHAEAKHCVRGVITEGTFASYRGVARDHLASTWLTWPLQWPLALLIDDSFSPREVIRHISPTPLLLVHGVTDELVPAHHVQQLFDAAAEPRDLWLLADSGHIGMVEDQEARERFVQWMLELEAGGAAGSVNGDVARSPGGPGLPIRLPAAGDAGE